MMKNEKWRELAIFFFFRKVLSDQARSDRTFLFHHFKILIVLLRILSITDFKENFSGIQIDVGHKDFDFLA